MKLMLDDFGTAMSRSSAYRIGQVPFAGCVVIGREERSATGGEPSRLSGIGSLGAHPFSGAVAVRASGGRLVRASDGGRTIRLPRVESRRRRTPLHARFHPEIRSVSMAGEDKPRMEAAATVQRAIEILEAAAEGRVTLPELVDRLGISKTSAFRIASTLVAADLLETSGRTGYRIGRRLQELGAAYSPPSD